MKRIVIVVLVCGISIPAWAGINHFPFRQFDDARYPKTREEIVISYRMLVDKRDGVNDYEAKIIAQYEAVEKYMDTQYDVSKPKIIDGMGNEWRVRLPAKFSVNQRLKSPDLLVCIDRKSGRVTCFSSKEGSH